MPWAHRRDPSTVLGMDISSNPTPRGAGRPRLSPEQKAVRLAKRREYEQSPEYKVEKARRQKEYMERHKEKWQKHYANKYREKRLSIENEREQDISNLVMRLFNDKIHALTLARRAASRDRRRRAEQRAQAILILGGRCAWCGLSNPMCLEIDHIRPVNRRTNGVEQHRSDRLVASVVSGNTEGLQLLCSNCHTIKTRLNNEYGIIIPADFDPLTDDLPPPAEAA